MLPESLRRSGALAFPAPIAAYFGSGPQEASSFTPDIYEAIKGLVRRFSDGDCLVSESAVEEVYERMTERHGAALAGAVSGECEGVAAASAALAAELASLRPIRAWVWEPNQASSPRHFFLSPNQYVAFSIGLAIAVKSRTGARRDDPPLSDEDIVNLVDFAVDARFSELSATITSRNPVAFLTKAFAEMLPFIA